MFVSHVHGFVSATTHLPLVAATINNGRIGDFENFAMNTGITALRESVWLYPILEIVHIVGIAMLLGNLVAFEARVLGASKNIDLSALARLALPLSVLGFLLAAMSGLTMFATQALELLENPAFKWKMLFLLIAGGNAAWFHARGSMNRADVVAKMQVVGSFIVWIAVLSCGRLIAYV